MILFLFIILITYNTFKRIVQFKMYCFAQKYIYVCNFVLKKNNKLGFFPYSYVHLQINGLTLLKK